MLLLRFKTILVGVAATLGVAAVALIAAVPGAGAASNSTTLVRGWNNVAYLGAAKAPADALSGIAGQYSSVYRWDAINAELRPLRTRRARVRQHHHPDSAWRHPLGELHPEQRFVRYRHGHGHDWRHRRWPGHHLRPRERLHAHG